MAEKSFLDKYKYLITAPTQFFEGIRKEGPGSAIAAYAITLTLSAIIGVINYAILSTIFTGMLMPPTRTPFSLYMGSAAIAQLIAGFTFPLLFTFAHAGLTHLITKLMGSKTGFGATVKAVCYSLVPTNVLSIIPYVGIFSYIYSIILMTLGIRTLHKLSTGKAVVAVLLPVGVYLAILFAVVLLMILFAVGYLSGR